MTIIPWVFHHLSLTNLIRWRISFHTSQTKLVRFLFQHYKVASILSKSRDPLPLPPPSPRNKALSRHCEGSLSCPWITASIVVRPLKQGHETMVVQHTPDPHYFPLRNDFHPDLIRGLTCNSSPFLNHKNGFIKTQLFLVVGRRWTATASASRGVKSSAV